MQRLTVGVATDILKHKKLLYKHEVTTPGFPAQVDHTLIIYDTIQIMHIFL